MSQTNQENNYSGKVQKDELSRKREHGILRREAGMAPRMKSATVPSLPLSVLTILSLSPSTFGVL